MIRHIGITNKGEVKMKKRTITLIVVISLAVLALLVGGYAILKHIISASNESEVQYNYANSENIPEEYVVEYPDVEEYYEENTDIVSVININDSLDTLSEEDVIDVLDDRGFNEFTISTDYSMDGMYYDPIEISDSSSDEHPMYETYYVNSSDEVWMIIVIDGQVMAMPFSYNFLNENVVPVIVSESEELVSYDSSTNRYYRTIPNDSVIDVRVVDTVNARTLDSLTSEVLAA